MVISAQTFLHALLDAAALGCDSFVAGCLLGPRVPPGRLRFGLAAAFGVCDGAASLLAGEGGAAAPVVAMWALGCASLAAGGVALRRRAWVLTVPLALSLDNLLSGVPASQGPGLAASSFVLAAAGLEAGWRFGRPDARVEARRAAR